MKSFVLFSVLLGWLLSSSVMAQKSYAPMVDAHTHYNWNQAENTSPEEVLAALDRQNITLAAFASTPTSLVLKLKQMAPARIFTFYSPYLTPMHRQSWHKDPESLPKMEKALASGQYQGIGEVHFIPGLPPTYKDPAVQGLLALAEKYQAPVLLHTDASSYRYFLKFCQGHPRVNFIWAHAGGILPAEQVSELLARCDNVMVELTARDPWRYVDSPISNDEGYLIPSWKAVVMQYPDRFMVGSDVVWPVVQLNSWFSEDSGWQRFDEFVNFHRHWISELPQEVQQKLLHDNGWHYYRQFMPLTQAP